MCECVESQGHPSGLRFPPICQQRRGGNSPLLPSLTLLFLLRFQICSFVQIRVLSLFVWAHVSVCVSLCGGVENSHWSENYSEKPV